MIKYILASASPRRRELLTQIGIEFEVSPACGEEKITKQKPSEIVEELSYEKACEVTEKYIDSKTGDTLVIIGADTIVAYGDEIMGKPHDNEDAKRMLTKLQGNAHQVYTGVTVIVIENGKKKVNTFHEKTDVYMYPMSKAQITAYVETGEPSDKAGAYAIQGKCAAYVKGINGDYNNVVGLPVARLMQEINVMLA